jgi:GGDEF domain-containing protein
MFPETNQFFESAQCETNGDDMIRIAVAIHKERGELLQILTATIRHLSTAGEESLRWLDQLEQEIACALELEDLQCLKPKLAECLERICRETASRKTTPGTLSESRENQGVRAQNDTGVQMGQQPSEARPAPVLDPVTGLPARQAAETAIERAYSSKIPVTPAVIVIDSLPAINMRFGRSTGDALLHVFANHLKQTLEPEDELYRWTGPAFVALLAERGTRPPGKTRRRRGGFAREGFTRLLEQKFEHTIQTASRDIHLSPAKRWIMLAFESLPDTLFHQIDSFISPALLRE